MDAAPLVALVIIGLSLAFLAGVVLTDAFTPLDAGPLASSSTDGAGPGPSDPARQEPDAEPGDRGR